MTDHKNTWICECDAFVTSVTLWYHLLIHKVWRLGTYATPNTLSVHSRPVSWPVLKRFRVAAGMNGGRTDRDGNRVDVMLWRRDVCDRPCLRYSFFCSTLIWTEWIPLTTSYDNLSRSIWRDIFDGRLKADGERN